MIPSRSGANRDYDSACVGVVGSALHLCSVNCFLRLSCASATLFRALIGTLNSRLQRVQTPTAGTVPSHLRTLRLRVVIDAVTLNYWAFRRCGDRALAAASFLSRSVCSRRAALSSFKIASRCSPSGVAIALAHKAWIRSFRRREPPQRKMESSRDVA